VLGAKNGRHFLKGVICMQNAKSNQPCLWREPTFTTKQLPSSSSAILVDFLASQMAQRNMSNEIVVPKTEAVNIWSKETLTAILNNFLSQQTSCVVSTVFRVDPWISAIILGFQISHRFKGHILESLIKRVDHCDRISCGKKKAPRISHYLHSRANSSLDRNMQYEAPASHPLLS